MTDSNGFELQDDGTVTSASQDNTSDPHQLYHLSTCEKYGESGEEFPNHLRDTGKPCSCGLTSYIKGGKMVKVDSTSAGEYQQLVNELKTTIEEMQKVQRQFAIAAYNFERSFVDNVKEVSSMGWTAEEARERYGL